MKFLFSFRIFNSIAFFSIVSNFIIFSTNILRTKLLTNYLDSWEYGVSVTILNLANFAIFISIFMLDQYLIRKGNDEREEIPKIIKTILLVYIFGLPLSLFAEYIIFHEIFSGFPFSFSIIYFIYTLLFGYLQILRSVFFTKKKYIQFYLTTTLMLIFWVYLLILYNFFTDRVSLIIVLKLMVVSLLIISIYFSTQENIIKLLFYKVKYEEVIKILRSGLTFSFWLIPYFLLEKILVLADKFFIINFLDKDLLGVYSLANVFPNVIFVFIGGIIETTKNKIFQSENDPKFQVDIVIKIIFLLYSIAIPIFILNKDLLITLISNNTLASKIDTLIFLMLIIVSMIHSLWTFCNILLQKQYKTLVIGILSIIGVILNILLNYILVVRFKLLGITIATFLSLIICTFIFIYKLGITKILLINFFKPTLHCISVTFLLFLLKDIIKASLLFFLVSTFIIICTSLLLYVNDLKKFLAEKI